jgi:hypothetical protein
VAVAGEMRNSYGILIAKSGKRRLGIDGRFILKFNLKYV